MAALVPVVVISALFVGWLFAEAKASSGPRIVLGMLCMAAFVGAWLSTSKRTAHLDAVHQACFRQIAMLIDQGDIATVKEAVDVYNLPIDRKHRAFQACDVLFRD